MTHARTHRWQPDGRTRVRLACALALVLAIGVSERTPAADCTANASPTSDCSNLSLAQQYINANIGTGVTVTSTTTNVPAVKITADQNSFSNSGTLQGSSVGAQGLNIGPSAGTITVGTVSNSGTIQGYTDSVGILVRSGATVTSLDNSGTVTGGSANAGLKNLGGTITTLTNAASGSITSTSQAGLFNATDTTTPGTIDTVINYGTISGATYGINNNTANGVPSTIGTITNYGTISGTTAGIGNSGTITTLNNAQAGSGLTYKGTLPTNYNIIISSTSNYGKLSGQGVSGSMNFGIYAGSSVTNGTYSAVLSGISASNLATTTGTYQSYPWYLSNRSGSIWDLIIGASTEDTQTSLSTTSSAARNLMVLKGGAMINGLQYDCKIMPSQNVCIATSGRHAQAIGRHATDIGGAFVIAVRIGDSLRLGFNTDQSFGGRVGDGGLKIGGHNSLAAVFVDWQADRRGLGPSLKLSAGYERTPMTVTRTVTGYSEPGSGSTQLLTRGLQLTARYGVNAGRWQFAPYAGVRQLRQGMDAYQESSSSTVSSPLSYTALTSSSRTALGGMEMDVALGDMLHLIASGGVEVSLLDSDVVYAATGVNGLSPITLNANAARRRMNAALGAYWLLAPDRRLALTGIYREEGWDGIRTARMLATYAASF